MTEVDARKRGRGKARKTIEMVEAMAEILEEIQPATVRAVCYRLFVAGHIDSMAKRNTDKVSRHLTTAREEGVIPWEWVVDENRQAERPPAWDDPGRLIEAAVEQYRKDYWRDQWHWVELWSEKGTVRGTLAPILDKYGITLRVMHGYSSATALHDVARETERTIKPLTVLYVGDWDPSGMHISEVDVPTRITRYHGAAHIRRLALTEADVRDPHLPSFDAASKSKDARHRWFVENFGPRCWELDAMSPPVLRQRVEDAVREYLDLGAWKHAVMVEQAEMQSMRECLGQWQETISRQASKYLRRDGGPA